MSIAMENTTESKKKKKKSVNYVLRLYTGLYLGRISFGGQWAPKIRSAQIGTYKKSSKSGKN